MEYVKTSTRREENFYGPKLYYALRVERRVSGVTINVEEMKCVWLKVGFYLKSNRYSSCRYSEWRHNIEYNTGYERYLDLLKGEWDHIFCVVGRDPSLSRLKLRTDTMKERHTRTVKRVRKTRSSRSRIFDSYCWSDYLCASGWSLCKRIVSC